MLASDAADTTGSSGVHVEEDWEDEWGEEWSPAADPPLSESAPPPSAPFPTAVPPQDGPPGPPPPQVSFNRPPYFPSGSPPPQFTPDLPPPYSTFSPGQAPPVLARSRARRRGVGLVRGNSRPGRGFALVWVGLTLLPPVLSFVVHDLDVGNAILFGVLTGVSLLLARRRVVLPRFSWSYLAWCLLAVLAAVTVTAAGLRGEQGWQAWLGGAYLFGWTSSYVATTELRRRAALQAGR